MTLKEAYAGIFDIGAAVSAHWLDEAKETVIAHFDSVTAENEMKYMGLHKHDYERPQWRKPKEGEKPVRREDLPKPVIKNREEFIHPNMAVDTADADKIYSFARENGIKVRGHNLSWHASYPWGIFEQLTPEELMANTDEHYRFVAEHFPDCSCWDVVNEAMDDKHGLYLRDTVYKQKFGEDYLFTLYGMARKYFPNTPLCCNDYNEWVPHKHENILKLLKDLKDRDLVDIIGCQCHVSAFMDDKTFDEIKRAYENYAKLGLRIHVTEMDVNCVSWEHREEVSDETRAKQAVVYGKLFKLFREYKDVIDNVTLWGVSDKHTWLNFFKNDGIKNSALLFDDDYKPTEAFYRVTDF